MQPTVNTTSTGGGFQALQAALAKIAAAEVYVGIPEDHSARKSADITNAALLYLHTNGSPLQGIPARPVIEPAIQASDNKAIIENRLAEAARSALAGDPTAARNHLEEAGQAAVNAAQRWFVDPRNGWPPNKPSTIARKGSDRPLIDTAQMRRAITYLVEEK